MAVKYKGLGYVTIATAGTPVVLTATPTYTPCCKIQAATTNAGVVYVGGNDLDATHRGDELPPGAALEITGPQIGGTEDEFDLAQVKVDAANNGDKVIVSYFARRE
jgi:hypothetical protein